MAQQVEALIAQIAEIDRQIDLNRAALYLRLRCIPGDARGWQNAWDRNPTFHARECDLFRQRGIAQAQRDVAEHKAHLREQRRLRRQRRAPLVERWATCALPMNASGCKLTEEDAAVFRRFSWLCWADRPGAEMCDADAFLRRERSYLLSLNA